MPSDRLRGRIRAQQCQRDGKRAVAATATGAGGARWGRWVQGLGAGLGGCMDGIWLGAGHRRASAQRERFLSRAAPRGRRRQRSMRLKVLSFASPPARRAARVRVPLCHRAVALVSIRPLTTYHRLNNKWCAGHAAPAHPTACRWASGGVAHSGRNAPASRASAPA